MEELDFTSEKVTNCVCSELALRDTECTDVHPEILHVSTRVGHGLGPSMGWVGLGWVRVFYFLVGWVGLDGDLTA